MQNKHKIVLAIAQELEIGLGSKLQAAVYYYCKINPINYSFIAFAKSNQDHNLASYILKEASEDHYSLGINKFYSFELENDIKTFKAKNYLDKKRYAVDLDVKDKLPIQKLKNQIGRSEVLLSEISSSALSVRLSSTVTTNPANYILPVALYTIGYEGISIDEYINKLLTNNIVHLVDVRQKAYSNKFGFSKSELKDFLERVNIKYTHIPQLGIEEKKREQLNIDRKIKPVIGGLFPELHNKAEDTAYWLFKEYKAQLPTKDKAVSQLKQILEQDKSIAITCFEADYKCCHRHVLADFLEGVEVRHL